VKLGFGLRVEEAVSISCSQREGSVDEREKVFGFTDNIFVGYII
jgi:hypothetical protein